jgi:hypothetical protein
MGLHERLKRLERVAAESAQEKNVFDVRAIARSDVYRELVAGLRDRTTGELLPVASGMGDEATASTRGTP